jgi:hypothetical protein
MISLRHDWDQVRTFETVHSNNHESLYRSYQILRRVRDMLERGDSVKTILLFIDWCERD